MNSQLNTKLAVVLFSDIVDFTKISSRSQSKAIQFLKQHEQDASELLKEFKGQLLKNAIFKDIDDNGNAIIKTKDGYDKFTSGEINIKGIY